MGFYYFVPIALGVTVLAQGILNRQFGAAWGLSTAVFVNAIVFFVLNGLLFAVAKLWPHILPEFLRYRDAGTGFEWTFLVPGICGFLLVLGLPWALDNIGPSKSFLLLIASQILSSLVADQWIFAQPVSTMKWIGGLITIIGTTMVVMN